MDIMDWKKRTYCGTIDDSHVGRDVLLMGWVDAIRDHGHVLFVHLRDNSGIVQVVFDLDRKDNAYPDAVHLKEEYVVELDGKVCLRPEGTRNPNLNTGSVEIEVRRMTVLAESRRLPFLISEKAMVYGEDLQSNPDHVDEELRLQYRYLDMRRPSMREHFVRRHKIYQCVREYLDQQNFIEVETPVLTKSTPEGARDYLVPSRTHPGSFYALPQSPQLFKQILMIGGMDRYFQIVKCFRDEDLRPNRQPEFTQLDLEASFVNEEFIYETVEELIVRMFQVGGISLDRPFPRMTYEEAMNRFGSDRPDMRFGMEFEDVTDLLENTGYSVFRRIIKNKGRVKGFCVKGAGAALSKNVLQNEYSTKIAPSFGARGMSWMKVAGDHLESSIVQFFSEQERGRLMKRFGAQNGDVIIMIADTSLDLVNKVLGKLRIHIAGRLRMIPADAYCPLWVTDFPMFESEGNRLSPMHHPFTMPASMDFDPENIPQLLSLKSRAYDIVMNGEELGGGSIRIHRMDVQQKIFEVLGLTEQEVNAKFGFLLKALEFGAPPHCGLALGLDRVIAMILNLPSIRDVIAFPKTRSAYCPLTEAPANVSHIQLQELSIESRRSGSEKTETGKTKPVKHAEKMRDRITNRQVEHIARLSRLRLTKEEGAQIRKDLNAILEYVDVLSEVDTDDVAPMHHVMEMKNVLREDTVEKSAGTEDILENAPEREKDYFKVPKILER